MGGIRINRCFRQHLSLRLSIGADRSSPVPALHRRGPGRSPVGKRIDALAPSANPDRLTDRAKADKWFDRNCKQVLGRPCTPAEKADVVTYLSSL